MIWSGLVNRSADDYAETCLMVGPKMLPTRIRKRLNTDPFNWVGIQASDFVPVAITQILREVEDNSLFQSTFFLPQIIGLSLARLKPRLQSSGTLPLTTEGNLSEAICGAALLFFRLLNLFLFTFSLPA